MSENNSDDGSASHKGGYHSGTKLPEKRLRFVTLIRDSDTSWKAVHYHTKNLLKTPFLAWVGTVFSIGYRIWILCLALCCICAMVVIFFYALGYNHVKDDGYINLTTYLNVICPFLIGLYLNEMLSRWWSLCEDIMDFHSSFYDVCMHVCACDIPRARYQRLVRYGLAAQIILFQVSRRCIDLQVLEDQGILLQEECEVLMSQTGNISQCLWVWISQDILDLLRISNVCTLVFPKVAFESCQSGRATFSKIASTLTTPLPFAYLHVVTLFVFFNNVIGAVKSGVVMFNCLKAGQGMSVIIAEMIFLIVPPLLYQGCLQIGQILENPFEDDLLNFPLGVYHHAVTRNCISIFNAARRRRELHPSAVAARGSSRESPGTPTTFAMGSRTSSRESPGDQDLPDPDVHSEPQKRSSQGEASGQASTNPGSPSGETSQAADD